MTVVCSSSKYLSSTQKKKLICDIFFKSETSKKIWESIFQINVEGNFVEETWNLAQVFLHSAEK